MAFYIDAKTEVVATALGDGTVLGKPLQWYLSLAGEGAVKTCELSATEEKPIRPYRYDWIVGIACPPKSEQFWDWQAQLRSEDALKIQVLIDCPKGVGWSDLSAQLLAFHPSRNTASWFEQNGPTALHAAASLANVIGKVIPGAAFGGELLNAIPSEGASGLGLLPGRKNWFLYRYYDSVINCPAVEWTISKDVIRQYGPLLRGSIILAFHGKPLDEQAPARLGLRAGLGFLKASDLEYVRAYDETKPEPKLAIQFDKV